MARDFQILDRDPAGAVWTLTVPAGEAFRAESNHSYRIVIDANAGLPRGTTVTRVGKDLKIRLPDGDEITISNWADTPGATLDTRGAQLLADSGAAQEQSFLASGEGGVAASTEATPAAATTGEPAAAAAQGAPAPTPATPPEVIAVPPPPVTKVAPVAGVGTGGGSGTAILAGVGIAAGLGAAAGGGGGGGGGGSTTPPVPTSAAPTDLALAAASDSGAQGDRITSDNTPTISGRAEANAAITVRNGAGSTIATATADASGNWTATPTAALADGAATLQVIANRGGGAADSAATNLTVTIDTTAPGAPVAQIDAASDSGTAGDGRTNRATPTISGTGSAGDAIRVVLPGGTALTTTVAANGTWSVTPAALAEGVNAISVTATDAAGNVSATTAFTITIDTTAPSAPVARLDVSSDSGTVGDNRTNDTTPTISGTGTAGDTIRVTMPAGPVLTTTVAANGTWSVTPTTAQATGANAVSVTAVDAAGNVSAATPLTITINTTGPAAPSAQLAAASDSGTLGDNVTSDTTPTISGTGTAGDTIHVTLPAGPVLTTTVAANGTWSVTPATAQANGATSVSVTATDAAGNVSAATTLTLTIDTLAPAAPVAQLAPTSDSGTVGDNLTNDTTPTISGTGTAGDTIRVTMPAGPVLTTTVAANGTWSVTPTTAQATGANAVSVTATDPAGNVSAATPLTITINTTGPAAPSAQLAAASDSGTLGDNVTSDTTPTISGTGTAGHTINVTLPAGPVLTTTVAANGTWSVTPSTPQVSGANALSVTATDPAGNVSAATALTVTIDTTAPAAPVAQLAAASDSGTLGDDLTNDTTPTISGTGTSGDTIRVTLPTGPVLTTTVAANGTWSVTPVAAQASGANAVSVTATDPAGNVSAPTTFTITIDATAPSAPSAPDLATASDTGASTTDNITNDVTPTFNGTGAQAGASVTLYDTDGTTVLGTDTADGAGAWSITASTLASGVHSVTARQVDAAGNASNASAPLAVTIDTTAPAAPVAQLAVASDSGTVGDNLTNDTTPTISGTGTSGHTIHVTLPAGPVLTTTVAVNGTWSVTPVTAQASGANAVSVTATDPAGNESAPTTFTITIDTAAPSAPSAPDLATASDTGVLNNDNITSDVTPTFTGTGAEAGATVTLYDTDGTTSLGTATANGAGAWSITASTLAAGVHSVTARQADAAGNASVASAPLAVTIDTLPPAAPPAPDLATASDTGALNNDNITSDVTPTFTGTGALAGATVTLYDTDGTTSLGTATADGAGAWSITTSTLAAGVHSVTARQSDGAGNASGASAPLAVTIDTTAPAAPVAQLAAASDSGTLGDNLTNDTTPTISGTGTSGDTINVTLPAGPVLTTTVAVNGTWSVTTGTVQASGANAVSVTATDPAGNVSAPTTFTITIDTTPPAAPSAPDLATASDTGTLTNDNITSDVTPTFTGTGAQAGASVTLYDTDGTTSLGTATADGAGAWSITASALAAGVHSVTARQADAAGNASVASAPLAVTIDTQGPTFGNALTVNEGFGPQTLSATTLAAADNVTAQGALTVTAATFQSGTGFVSGDVVINVAGGQATVTPNGGAANKNGNVVVALTMQDAAGNSTAHNVTITVTPVNDAPSGTDATLLTVQNNNLVFGAGSFGLTDAVDSPANALQGVVITTLPAAGQLLLNGAPVSAGQEVAAAEIVAGHLVFAPALNGLGTGYATFTFQVRDNGGTANGGVDLDSTPNVITIDVAAPLQLDAASGGDSLAALLPGGPSDGYLVLADNGSGLLGLSVGAAPAVALASPDAFAPAPPSAGGDLLSPGSEVSGSSLAYLA